MYNTIPCNPFPPSSEDMGGGGGEPYVLPVASADKLGGVKVGNNLSIDDGVLSAPEPYTLAYSSTPVSIGTWINGDVVKMRVFSFDQSLDVSNSSWTLTGLTLENAKLLKCFGINDGKTCYPLMGSIDENNVIKLSVGRTSSGALIDALIVEYTESEG